MGLLFVGSLPYYLYYDAEARSFTKGYIYVTINY